MQNRQALNLLIVANIISGIAQGISMISIPWYINNILDEPALFGTVYAISCVLSLFWGIWSGAITDRYDRLKVMMGYNTVAGLFITAISLWGFWQGSLSGMIVMIVFAFNFMLYVIHYPTLYAFVQEITEPQRYGTVASKLEIQGQTATFLAGAGAAILLEGGSQLQLLSWQIQLPFHIEAWGMHKIFFVDGISYFIAVLIFSSIRYMRIADRIIDTGSIRERLSTAHTFYKKNPSVVYFGLGSAGVFLTIITGTNQVTPLYIKNFLHASVSVYASAEMYFALGAIAAGFFIKKITRDHKEIRNILLASMLAMSLYFVLITYYNVHVFLMIFLLLGFFNATIRIMRFSIFFQVIPNAIYGRIGSYINIYFTIIRLFVILLLTQSFFYENVLYAYTLMMFLILLGMIVVYTSRRSLRKDMTKS